MARPRWRRGDSIDALMAREWQVTNGLGGYASGTVGGAATRRFHGPLVAALPAPLGRVMMMNHLAERASLADGSEHRLDAQEGPGGLDLGAAETLEELRLELGLPVWRWSFGGVVLEKRVVMPRRQNTTYLVYTLLRGRGLRLRLRPSLNIRAHEGPVAIDTPAPYRVVSHGDRFQIEPGEGPTLRMRLLGERRRCLLDGGSHVTMSYRIEAARGYDHTGELWSPGELQFDLDHGASCALVLSTEPWHAVEALTPDDALSAEQARRRHLVAAAHPALRQGPAAELVLAADQFLIAPATRVADEARAHAEGDEAATVIAGYPWFTDWGRDTMISLEGLTLVTGRHAEAGRILRTFAHHVRDGLVPNMFPEGAQEGLYHTADATLWFFHAVDRYVTTTGDRDLLRHLLPTLEDIVEHHVRGTRFGIGVDPTDGLLRQGAEGYQLTWMDAKVDGWVVTPRRGKAVEINALFYNALRLLEGWLSDERGPEPAARVGALADRLRASFTARFWDAERGHLIDVVDGEGGDDPALRPNQLLSLSLRHAVLEPAKWPAVVEVVHRELWTPVGLRSLGRHHPDYRTHYDGDLRSRDAAYHQGTVWGWLIGPFVDAFRRVHPERRDEARALLAGFAAHLDEACLGTISEIFDAEEPFHPRGCHAQAWSVAEVLRCLVQVEG
jgi:predicted glycogen debranching enzyme